MPLVITINPNSGELQSNISLLSLCNTQYLRHFPSCSWFPGGIFFPNWHIPHIVLWLGEEVVCMSMYVGDTVYVWIFGLLYVPVAADVCVRCVQFDISTPHALTHRQKAEWPYLSPGIHLSQGLQSISLRTDQKKSFQVISSSLSLQVLRSLMMRSVA